LERKSVPKIGIVNCWGGTSARRKLEKRNENLRRPWPAPGGIGGRLFRIACLIFFGSQRALGEKLTAEVIEQQKKDYSAP